METHGDSGNAVFWDPLGVPLLPKNRVCNFIHPKQLGPFPKSLISPYPEEEILSGYEEDVSSIRDGFSAWVTTDPENTLRRHIVDAKGDNPERHQPGNTLHPTRNTVLTTMCPTD